MTELSQRLEHALFKTPGFMDPPNQHHELASGMHGRKGDFGEDIIVPGSYQYDLWVAANVEKVTELCPAAKLGSVALVSVDSGTNRLVRDVADEINEEYDLDSVKWFNSKKVSRNASPLPKDVGKDLVKAKPEKVYILEDFGTTGGTSATTALSVRYYMPDVEIDVINTIQRQFTLSKLAKLAEFGIKYHNIIYIELPTYSEGDCRAVGYCADDVKLIRKM